MSPIDILQTLYDNEINWQLSCFFDGGYTAKLGDDINGFKEVGDFASLDDAVKWLWSVARCHYPELKQVANRL